MSAPELLPDPDCYPQLLHTEAHPWAPLWLSTPTQGIPDNARTLYIAEGWELTLPQCNATMAYISSHRYGSG